MNIFRITEGGCADYYVMAPTKKIAEERTIKAILDAHGSLEDDSLPLESKEMNNDEPLTIGMDSIPIQHTVEEWLSIFYGLRENHSEERSVILLACSEY